jgi:hypothetical protein
MRSQLVAAPEPMPPSSNLATKWKARSKPHTVHKAHPEWHCAGVRQCSRLSPDGRDLLLLGQRDGVEQDDLPFARFSVEHDRGRG